MKRKKRKIIFPPVPGGGIGTDPFGSYTGLPLVVVDEPEQDADDL